MNLKILCQTQKINSVGLKVRMEDDCTRFFFGPPKKREPHSLSGREFQPSQIDSDPPKPYQEVSEPRLATRMVTPIAQQSVYTRTKPRPTECPTTAMRTMCHRFQQGSSSFTNSYNEQLLFLSVLFTENGSKPTVIS